MTFKRTKLKSDPIERSKLECSVESLFNCLTATADATNTTEHYW